MEKVSAELLAEDGIEIDAVTLASYRRVAANFKRQDALDSQAQGQEPERDQRVSFGGHESAGSSDMLKKIVKKLEGEKKPLSVGNIRRARNELEDKQVFPPARNPNAVSDRSDDFTASCLDILAKLMGIKQDIAKLCEQYAAVNDDLRDVEAGAINEALASIMNEAHAGIIRRRGEKKHLTAIG